MRERERERERTAEDRVREVVGGEGYSVKLMRKNERFI